MIIVIQPNSDWPRIHQDECPSAQPIGENPLPRYPIAEPVAAAMLTAIPGLSCTVCTPHLHGDDPAADLRHLDSVIACMRYLTNCEQWRVAVLDGVQVVLCPVQPLLTTIQAELRLIEQIGKDVVVIRAEPGGA